MAGAGCGVRRGGKYADGLVQQGVGALRRRGEQIEAAVNGVPAPAAPPATPTPSKSYGQLDAEIAAARAKMLAPKKFLGMFKDGAVIPGHDTEGSDDVDVKVTRGEAILPVKTVDAMGGPMAVSDMIHATNGKPPAGVRRGGRYAVGMTDEGETPPGQMPPFKMPGVFDPRTYGGMPPLTPRTSMSPEQALGTAQSLRTKQKQSALVDQIPNEFAAAPAPTTTPAAAPPTTTPTAAPQATPSTDPRLAALGVTSEWNKMARAADQPIQGAEIYATGSGSRGQPTSYAGYGTQTPEMEAAAQAKADAARVRLEGINERTSQAILGKRIAQARLQGEDFYADKLEREAALKGQAALEKAKVGAGSEGLGALRAAQTGQIGQEVKQTAAKQAMTDEYLNAATTPERRKALAATLGIKPDSGWQISTTFGPPDTMGQPTKSTIAHRTTASGELETRDLSGGTQQAGVAAPIEGAKSTSGGKPIIFKNGKWEFV